MRWAADMHKRRPSTQSALSPHFAAQHPVDKCDIAEDRASDKGLDRCVHPICMHHKYVCVFHHISRDADSGSLLKSRPIDRFSTLRCMNAYACHAVAAKFRAGVSADASCLSARTHLMQCALAQLFDNVQHAAIPMHSK